MKRFPSYWNQLYKMILLYPLNCYQWFPLLKKKKKKKLNVNVSIRVNHDISVVFMCVFRGLISQCWFFYLNGICTKHIKESGQWGTRYTSCLRHEFQKYKWQVCQTLWFDCFMFTRMIFISNWSPTTLT